MPGTQPDYYEYLNFDENSEDAISLSSEEENNDIDICLHSKEGTRHFKKSDENIHASSSEHFDKALEAQIDAMCKDNLPDEMVSKLGVDNKHDEDFYDSGDDMENEKWVEDIRQSYRPLDIPAFRSSKLKTPKAPLSDAVLNCPCCMTLLCLDCQRHDRYKTQYRAMFVMNCDIDASRNLFYPPDSTPKFGDKKRKKTNFAEGTTEPSSVVEIENLAPESLSYEARDVLVIDGKPTPLPLDILNDSQSVLVYDVYKNVNCSICKTQVAVYDKEDVYHFYNVLASY